MSKRQKIDYWFDQDKVDHVIEWIETYCTHVVGDKAGDPLILPEWFKKDVIAPTFGWKKPDGLRRYQEVYEEIASGNAKSTLGIALALYCQMADGQMSPHVYCVAGSKDQARIMFEGAKTMVTNHPDLIEAVEVFRDSLVFKHPVYGYSVMKVISADGDLQQGLNPTAIFFDELHVQPSSYLYDSLKKNFAKRKEPLLFEFTTAGVQFTFAWQMHLKALDVRDGKIKAPGFLPVIYASDLEGDDFDEDQWRMANPGWDYLNLELIREAAEDAKKSATDLAAFRRYRLNKWAGANVTWIPAATWAKGTACESQHQDDLRLFRKVELSKEALKGRKCYLAIDLSSSRDTTANVYIFPPDKEGERVKVYKRVFIPKLTLQQRIKEETGYYGEWAERGEIVVTNGETQSYEDIFADIEEHAKIFDILCVAYDSWNADEIVSKLIKMGMECKAYKQNYADMNTPMKKIEELLATGKLEHGGDPVLAWHCGNTEAKTRTIGGSDYMMPSKSTDKGRIDAMVAFIMAVGIWVWKTQEAEKVEQSMIASQGIVKIQVRR